ncbi:MAG: hypothetical protein ACP5D2_02955 [Candidatus Nanoarchaeia archaeon]
MPSYTLSPSRGHAFKINVNGDGRTFLKLGDKTREIQGVYVSREQAANMYKAREEGEDLDTIIEQAQQSEHPLEEGGHVVYIGNKAGQEALIISYPIKSIYEESSDNKLADLREQAGEEQSEDDIAKILEEAADEED